MTVKAGLTRTYAAEGGHLYTWNGGEPMPGVTTILNVQDYRHGADRLKSWAVRVALEATRSALEDGLDLAFANGRRAPDEPARLGGVGHAALNALLMHQPVPLDADALPFYPGLAQFFAEKRPALLFPDSFVVNLTARYGGAFDACVEIDGEVWLLDLKTGNVKPSHALQLAGYSLCEFIGVEGDPKPYPLPTVDRFGVLQVRPGEPYALHEMKVGRAEQEHFLYLAETFHRLQAWEAEREQAAA